MSLRERPPFSRRGEQAIQAFQEAALADAMPRSEAGDDVVHAAEAELARARADLYLKPVAPIAVSAGEAVTWENKAVASTRHPGPGVAPPITRRGEQAILAFQEADHIEKRRRTSLLEHDTADREATRARERAEILLQPAAGPIEVSAGEAISWDNKIGEPHLGATALIVDTLEHPNTVSAGASGRRMSAALSAGVLEPAIDAAQSAQASNSIEKMLCHQIAGAHFGAMRLLELMITVGAGCTAG